jgi:hypothetical protein
LRCIIGEKVHKISAAPRAGIFVHLEEKLSLAQGLPDELRRAEENAFLSKPRIYDEVASKFLRLLLQEISS